MQNIIATFENGSGATLQLFPTRPNHATVEFTPGASVDIRSLRIPSLYPEHPELIVEFKEACTPENPAYLRWINRIGGYEYQMFSERITERLKTANVSTFEPYSNSNEFNSHPVRMLGATANRSMIVGAYQVDRFEIKRLEGLLVSPRVELYDINTGQWVGVIAVAQTSEIGRKRVLFDFEIELDVAKVNLQL